jgi:phenylalanyl-tRNA synthetase beta chain
MQLGPKVKLAWFGELHPATLESLGVDDAIVGFELILGALPHPKAKPTKTKPPLDATDLQAVRRDFAFVVERGVAADQIVSAARRANPLVASVVLFDLFEGEAIGAGRKSVAIEVTLQPGERTLTEAEIDEISSRIVADVGKATGAELRS